LHWRSFHQDFVEALVLFPVVKGVVLKLSKLIQLEVVNGKLYASRELLVQFVPGKGNNQNLREAVNLKNPKEFPALLAVRTLHLDAFRLPLHLKALLNG